MIRNAEKARNWRKIGLKNLGITMAYLLDFVPYHDLRRGEQGRQEGEIEQSSTFFYCGIIVAGSHV